MQNYECFSDSLLVPGAKSGQERFLRALLLVKKRRLRLKNDRFFENDRLEALLEN